MAWSQLPIPEDPETVIARILDGLTEAIPGWTPREGDPLVALAEELGRENAELRQMVRSTTDLAVAVWGESLFGVAAFTGVEATLQARVTVTAVGAVIPENFTVVGRTTAGQDVAFTLLEPVVADSLTPEVTLTATVVGRDSNDVPPGPLTLVTATPSVVTVEALSASVGGVDEETLDAYLDRLTDVIGILRPGGVLAEDMAILSRSVLGVHRALGLDNYDAETNAEAVRTVTIVPIDETGNAVDEETREAVRNLLEGVRETNFTVRVATPTYAPINIVFEAVAEPNTTPEAVQASIHAAALDYLNPANWAVGSDPNRPVWRESRIVRYLDVARVIGSAEGVAYLVNLTINGDRVDYTMPGVAPLPALPTATNPTTVTGVVR